MDPIEVDKLLVERLRRPLFPHAPAQGLTYVWLEDVLPPGPKRSRWWRIQRRFWDRWDDYAERLSYARRALRGDYWWD